MAASSLNSSGDYGGEEPKARPGSASRPRDHSQAARREERARRVSALLRHISDPTRLEVILLLAEGEHDVSTLCVRLGRSQPKVSHQLALLRAGGVIAPRRKGARRFYALTDTGCTLAGVVRHLFDQGEAKRLAVRPRPSQVSSPPMESPRPAREPWLAPIKVREIPPGDEWLNPISSSSDGTILSSVVAEEQNRPAADRADVLYFDLPRLKDSGLSEDSVNHVAEWADRYHRIIPIDEIPATLVAIGQKVSVKGRRRLADADVYFLDERRRSIRRIMGTDGERYRQIDRLIRKLSGDPIAPAGHPRPAAASSTCHSRPSNPSASDWDVYVQRPQHVDHAEVETLFKLLTQQPEAWERDY